MRNYLALTVCIIGALAASGGAAAASASGGDQPPRSPERPREQIGEVLGTPVYRDQIRTGEGIPLSGELHRLFSAPMMQKYRKTHQAEIEPTKEEIDAATAYFDQEHQKRMKEERPELPERLKAIEEQLAAGGLTEQEQQKLEAEKRVLELELKPPGRFFAVFMLRNWKFQRHLYDHYGGGRILWQQAGLEAFDAMRNWLEAHEKRGDFKITDPMLRASFYEYWTTMNHGPFLTDDKERIRTEFLEPQWVPRQPDGK